MRGLDDGPDGLNEDVFNRLLGGKPKVKTKRRSPSVHQCTRENTTCVCGHAFEEHGHNDQYPGSTECSECADCVAYEASGT